METAEKTVKEPEYRWHLIVRELLEGMFLSQEELAAHCRVSQQSISNWKNKVRKPGDFARQKLLELARKENIDPGRYEPDPLREEFMQYLEKNKGKDLVRLISLCQKMSDSSRIKLQRYARTLVK